MYRYARKENLVTGLIDFDFFTAEQLGSLRASGVNDFCIYDELNRLTAEQMSVMGVSRQYESLSQMLADPLLDIIHISTNSQGYYANARAAILAGKHVICEKPVMLSVGEMEDLIQLSTLHSVVCAINFNARMFPFIKYARNMIQSGELGEIQIIRGVYAHDGKFYIDNFKSNDSQHQPPTLNSIDLSIYWVDLINFIVGQNVVEVFTDTTQFNFNSNENQVDTARSKGDLASVSANKPDGLKNFAIVLLHYPKDIRGTLTLSQVSAGRENYLSFEINGSNGSISWNTEQPFELWVGHHAADNKRLTACPSLEISASQTSDPMIMNKDMDTFSKFYACVYDYVLSNDYSQQPQFPSLIDVLPSIKVREAIRNSAQAFTWVKVN